MNGPIARVIVLDLMRCRNQINIVHGKIVKTKPLCINEANIDQGGAIEAVLVGLINHKDFVINPGLSQECINRRCEFKEFVKSISNLFELYLPGFGMKFRFRFSSLNSQYMKACFVELTTFPKGSFRYLLHFCNNFSILRYLVSF